MGLVINRVLCDWTKKYRKDSQLITRSIMGSLLQGWQDEWMCKTREPGNLAETYLLLAFKTEL